MKRTFEEMTGLELGGIREAIRDIYPDDVDEIYRRNDFIREKFGPEVAAKAAMDREEIKEINSKVWELLVHIAQEMEVSPSIFPSALGWLLMIMVYKSSDPTVKYMIHNVGKQLTDVAVTEIMADNIKTSLSQMQTRKQNRGY